jgi:hypothetical protein
MIVVQKVVLWKVEIGAYAKINKYVKVFMVLLQGFIWANVSIL